MSATAQVHPHIISTMDNKEQTGRAIGRIPSGVFIITIDRLGMKDGLMASWIAQAAFDPPLLSVAIKKERHILDLMGVGTKFSVNVLSKKNMDIFKNFVKPFEPGMDRFEGLPLLQNTGGGPVFSQAVAYMDCLTRGMVEAGDHIIVIGEIVQGQILNPDLEPMVHLRSNGFQY